MAFVEPEVRSHAETCLDRDQSGIGSARRHALALAITATLTPCTTLADEADAVIEEVTVRAERIYRDRASLPSPTLLYGVDYFQHFEPLALGDLLKRVPGVSFNGDLGEFDAPQLRGLAPQYTQILINGERVPGASDDGSILVNRIPTELIERVEVIRSPSADIDGQGIGGTVNVVLKDAAGLDGGEWRLSAQHHLDGSAGTQGAGSLSYGRHGDGSSLLLAANVQQRASPKTKTELTLDPDGDFEQLSQSDDLRESDDHSLLANLGVELASGGRFKVDASLVDTRIVEDERLKILDQVGELDAQRHEQEDIDQRRTQAEFSYRHPLGNDGVLTLALTTAQFEENLSVIEAELEDDEQIVDLDETRATEDDDRGARLSYRIRRGAHELSTGIQALARQRRVTQRVLELAEDEDEERKNLEDVTPGSGNYRVELDRLDAYLNDHWTINDRWEAQFGARVEHTRVSQRLDASADSTYTDINPSLHVLYQPDDSRQFRLSVAQTVRRPGFDQIVPVLDRDTPAEDQSTIGNPELNPERALGFDLGFEQRRAGGDGVVGVNVFYREISDKIEITQLDEDLFTYGNIGTGESWGVELDISRPLDLVGLPNAGIYFNFAWLDSSINDPISGARRRFNAQPDWVGNLDFIHDLPARQLSYGFSYQQQGEATEFLTTEVSTLRFDGNLEFFVEKTLGSGTVIRFSASNLLDAVKHDRTLIFDDLEGRIDQSPAQTLIEEEQTGPVLMITLRSPF